MYKVVILASKVKFDLAGQRSFGKKIAHLIYEVLFRYLKLFCIYTHLKFTFWPQRSKLASEVKGHKVDLLGYIRRVNIQNFVKIGPL